MSSSVQLRVGLLGIGLEAYWPQFEGLKERLEGYIARVADKLHGREIKLLNLGLIDNTQSAVHAGSTLRREDVDILLLYVTTYALSSTVLPLVQRAKIPVIILNLQPTAAIDYSFVNRLPDRTAMTAEWLPYCSACTVPEIANVLRRAGIAFHQVTGILEGDPGCWREIQEWITAAGVAKVLAHNRLGLVGHYYSGMLDIVTDLTQLSITFGSQIEHYEVEEIGSYREQATEPEIHERLREFTRSFDIQPDCLPEELTRAAITSIALDRFVAAHDLTSMAYYYKGTGGTNEDTISSIILGTSLLTARGVPVAGEYEVKNAIAMKIMDSFGVGGSFTEYYALDLNDDIVLMGHDGPGHIAIAEGKPKIRPLSVYHGKVGRGLSVEMSVKHGPVTLLSVVEDRARGFKLLLAEGESVAGPILEIGNTNSRYRFSLGARGFVDRWNSQGPAHHCAIGIGHIASKIEKLGSLLAIDVVQIC